MSDTQIMRDGAQPRYGWYSAQLGNSIRTNVVFKPNVASVFNDRGKERTAAAQKSEVRPNKSSL